MKIKKKSARYVSFPFISLFPFLQIKLNRPLDLGKEIKSLNHFVYILIIYYFKKCQLCVKVSKWRGFKNSKKIYTSHLKERLESHIASTSFIAFGTTNHYCLIRQCFESRSFSNYRQSL